ncbi:MAG: hypothetical protein ABSE62_05290 [Chthoniobacteraceae bacterium]|jgi:hypothetical protein
MFLQETKTKRGGKTYISYLVRESFRTADGPRGRTVCNLTHLPKEVRDMVGQALRGAALVPLGSLEVNNAHGYGGCVALEDAARRYGIPALLAPLSPRSGALVQAMIFGGLLFAPSIAPFFAEARTARLAGFCGLDPERERFAPADLAAALHELDQHWQQISTLLVRPPHSEVRAITLFRTSRSEIGAVGMDADGIPVPLAPGDAAGAGLRQFLLSMGRQSKSGPPLLALDEESASQMHLDHLPNQPRLIDLAPQSLANLLRQLNPAQVIDALRGGGPIEVRHHGERYIFAPVAEPREAEARESAMRMGSLKELTSMTAPQPEITAPSVRSAQPAIQAAFQGVTTNVPAERLPAPIALEWSRRARAGRAAFLPVQIVLGRSAAGEGPLAWRNHPNLQFLTHRLRCHLHAEWRGHGEHRPVEEVLRDLQEVHRATLTVDGVVVRRLATHPSKSVAALLTKLRLWRLFNPSDNARK